MIVRSRSSDQDQLIKRQIKIIRSRSAYKASKVWLTDDIITVSLAQKFGSKKPKSQKYLGSKNK